MTENEIRAEIIAAGLKLKETGLIARTWGNISARLSETAFIITPSGRAYEDLKPEDLVIVQIADCSYEGDIKPSGESGIHAEAYAQRPDVQFIVHTHQLYASAVAAEGLDTDPAPCAAYGLPGTKKLRKGVRDTLLAYPEARKFLLAKHGAFLLGNSFEDAFALASELEEEMRVLFSHRTALNTNGRVPDFLKLYSAGNRTLAAYIDDFAQLVGKSAALKKGKGLAKEPSAYGDDAEAVRMIAQKNAAAALYVRGGKPMATADALIQHAVYVRKYSKLKESNRKDS